jgi:raffinose synthase
LADGCISSTTGTPILEGVSSSAWVSSETGSEYLILGAEADGPVSLADFPLGLLRCKRWLACARNKLWWMTPEWGSVGSELPPETQFLLLELENDSYAILLPLIDQNTFRGTLRPPK